MEKKLIDTHLHLWDPAYLRYPWLDTLPLLNRPFHLKDYNAASRGLAVEKMVFVQCECLPAQSEEELAWVTSLAKKDNRIRGIIPCAPLEDAGVGQILRKYAKNPLVKGIRRIIQFEADPGRFCRSDTFLNNLRSLENYGFVFEICIHHSQLEIAVQMVANCPAVQFVLDHLGKPDVKSGAIHTWQKNIAALSKFPNVSCKISGLVTEADPESWKTDDLRPYVLHALACFGPERVMFGGDWPVVLLASGYRKWVNSLEDILAGRSPKLRDRLFRRNAEICYGI